MKINLIELLNSSSISNPLYLAYKNGTNYFSDFEKKFDDLISHKKLNEKEAEDILKNKLQLSKKNLMKRSTMRVLQNLQFCFTCLILNILNFIMNRG